MSQEEIEAYGTAAADALAAFTGTEPGQESLSWISDVIRGRRARTQVKVLARTLEEIDAAGLTGRVVPNKTLVPLLEFAGLEDENDDEMIDRWANLLANASASTLTVPPSYVDFLRVLEPVEARMLDALANEPDAITVGVYLATLPVSDDIDWPHLVNVERLGLIKFASSNPRWDGATRPQMDHVSLELTTLGEAFTNACRRPAETAS